MAAESGSDIYADTLAVFEESGPAEPLTTPEVAEALGANRRTVYKRLRTLVDRGRLETKSVGSRARVWWLPVGSVHADAGRRVRGDAPVPEEAPADRPGRPPGDRTAGHEPGRVAPASGTGGAGGHRLDSVVRRAGVAAARGDDRSAVGRGVCEALREFGPYRVAAIGELSPAFDRFRPSACVGADEADLPMAESADADRPPAVRAVETGEVQVASALEDGENAPWRAFAAAYDVASYAAVPLVHDEALYGVLGVFVEGDGFDEAHRRVLADLGEIVGSALYDRGHSEVLDPTIELEFRTATVHDAFRDVTGVDATLSFDSAVPMADGTRLQYWTVRGMAPKTYRDAVRRLPTVVNTRLLSTVGDTARFELRVAGRTFAAVFDDLGGRLRSAEIRDDAAYVVGEFPRGVDAGSVVAATREAQPDVDLVARRNVLSPTSLRGLVDDELTDRQATVLRLAYFGGYFDRPRGSSGAELAERLDVTRQTFNHHLRAAEETIVRQFFERPATTRSD